MKKLDLQTPDLTEVNITKIAQLFPQVVTEAEDEDGKLIKKVDFDLLRQELSKDIVEDTTERYRLDRPGKKRSILKANTPITKTLRPVKEDSVNWDTTENLYLEWDNFEILKILQESYLGKIKMIYLDPPYNTGKDFVYKDDFKVSKDEYEAEIWTKDEEWWRLFKNTDTNGRYHSDWLSMMYSRLTIARDLLTDDWVIFMSIDDNEVTNLKKICDEVFGEENFIEIFIVRSNPRWNQAKKYTASEHEYIITYSKDIAKISLLWFDKEEGDFNKKDEDWRLYRELGLRKRWAGARRQDAPNQFYPIYYNEKTKDISTVESIWYIDILPKLSDGSDWRWRWAKKTVEENKKSLIIRHVKRDWSLFYDVFEKDYFDSDKLTKIKSIFYEKEFNQENATEELKILFKDNKPFDYPKPVYTIKYILNSIDFQKDDIILDFFSWSATTAHAVMQLNAEDGWNRKFIMAQLPEETDPESEAYKAGYKYITDIGKERIRRAGKKILEENKDTLAKRETPLDIWFRVYKTDSSNMKDVYYHPSQISQDKLGLFVSNVKDDRTPEDLLTQVMLDLGLTLDLSIEEKKIKGNKVFFVAGNSLVACFDQKIDFAIVDEIAESQPLKVVFRDASFADDKDRINVETRMKRLSPETIVSVI